MPGLAQRNNDDEEEYVNETVSFNACSKSISSNGFWSKHRQDISNNQLLKFWSELSPQARQDILRIDKQTLFEQARKNMYCSRCNGLLLEGYHQIVMYGKSLQHEDAVVHRPCGRVGTLKDQCDGELRATTGSEYDVQDPSVHPWGGLTTTRNGMLTLLDCYLYAKSLKGLQNVFDSSRARERERELLYPDACGGGARGWISQGMATYGRGHGTRETCALHTTRLSVDTLVDFWTALGDETRQSLLKMKEEDFMERLMYRFDSKRFCRDCRRNVIREFKELKELKRMRREPHCSSWFCVADAAFLYEVSHDTIVADWHQAFIDTFGTYHHFEWAVGTGEGKCDILDYENVGLSGRVQVSGLDLSGFNACYITLRAWKLDGRCTELSVKAHALKGQQCVHCRLVVGDGFVTITRGESIRRFFEHAEEAEEEEDDDSMDKDGNELDGECSRPQKHAKSPELAREFLLDAATVIFKEQVEKAFREGTARQNAHSIFVCLALKLLEERIHVACKDIITLEKQMKLLEEEEKEKREEEERRERRRVKEKEKKLRRKERLREKEKDREKKSCDSNQSNFADDDVSKEESSPNVDEESNLMSYTDSVSEAGEVNLSSPLSPNDEDDLLLDGYNHPHMQIHSDDYFEESTMNEGNDSFATDHVRHSGRLKFRKEFEPDSSLKWFDGRRFSVVSGSGGVASKYEPRHRCDNFEASRSTNRLNKQLRSNAAKSSMKDGASKLVEKFNGSNNRMYDRYDSSACSCNQHIDDRVKLYPNLARGIGNNKPVNKAGCESDISKPYYGTKYNNQVEYVRENCVRPKSKMAIRNNLSSRDSSVIKKVWEPMELRKKYPRSSSDSDVTLRSSTFQIESTGIDEHPEPSVSNNLGVSSPLQLNEENGIQELRKSSSETKSNCASGFHLEDKSLCYVKEVAEDEVVSCLMPRSSSQRTLGLSQSSSSNSDNCSSCLSEGDSATSFSNPHNSESSSTSDSEECSKNSEGRETSEIMQNRFAECYEVAQDKRNATDRGEDVSSLTPNSAGTTVVGSFPTTVASKNANVNGTLGMRPQPVRPPVHNQGTHFPRFQAPPVDYYYQTPPSWATAPATGFMPFPHPSHYVFASPFSYGLNANTHFMQHGALQHLIPPPVNPGHMPVFQSVVPTNDSCTKEHAKVMVGRLKDPHHEANVQRMDAVAQHTMEKSTTVGAAENEESRNSGFSLFSFTPDPFSLKEGMVRNVSSNLSANHIAGESGCNKKEPIEEYNPFANRIEFSFSDIVR
ncbi:uncharacterized protein LOC132049171 [Lycium ferocissimum]|uniref:uncharacterized protein LOC132049171 n=1 Tax=Lycium ferocissimum TaxID=112874 RepID=UPI0028159324|nr:uncharacterized protein LOC132049171 [Lycium ferocissimum]